MPQGIGCSAGIPAVNQQNSKLSRRACSIAFAILALT
jgi:hypothetical protein